MAKRGRMKANRLQGKKVGADKEVSLGQKTHRFPSGCWRGGEDARSCGQIRAGRGRGGSKCYQGTWRIPLRLETTDSL